MPDKVVHVAVQYLQLFAWFEVGCFLFFAPLSCIALSDPKTFGDSFGFGFFPTNLFFSSILAVVFTVAVGRDEIHSISKNDCSPKNKSENKMPIKTENKIILKVENKVELNDLVKLDLR